MDKHIYSSLPTLAKDLQFRVEKTSTTENQYAVGSILKLFLHRRDLEIPVYIYRSGDYTALGTLTTEEQSILDSWLETVKNKKIE
jgi:hypothetical protein